MLFVRDVGDVHGEVDAMDVYNVVVDRGRNASQLIYKISVKGVLHRRMQIPGGSYGEVPTRGIEAR